MKTGYTYIGDELELFSRASNWKGYVASCIQPYILGDVAEVGAGTGNFTPYLQSPEVHTWTYVEPDHNFREAIRSGIAGQQLPAGSVYDALQHLPANTRFDTILYLDVLEHIENDRAEIETMTALLKPGGHVVLLAPAYPFLYSLFDKEIGHFRRYTRKHLAGLFRGKEAIVFCKYLDSAGFFTSLANRFVLKQPYPTPQQIRVWDTLLIPLSKISDKLFLHSFGRSVILVWKKNT